MLLVTKSVCPNPDILYTLFIVYILYISTLYTVYIAGIIDINTPPFTTSEYMTFGFLEKDLEFLGTGVDLRAIAK